MAVLMTYHKLVERDSKNIDIHWKAASIILLVISIVCSLAVSISLQKITSAYDDRCVFDANLIFEVKEEFSPRKNLAGNSTSNSTDSVEVGSLLNETYINYLSLSRNIKLPQNELKNIQERQINERLSTWGSKSKCDFSIYAPICQSCFALVVLTMFIICGKGGKGDENAYLSEPWRIVSPSLFFLICMTIISLVNLVMIETGMNSFCDAFEKFVPSVSCATAMNSFMKASIDKFPVSPAKLRIILTTFNYLTLFAWLTSTLVLVARIVFVIDFQLVRVTVKTVEYDNSKDSFKVIEVENSPNGKETTSPC